MGAPALFVDRDGTLNERRVPFVRASEEFAWRPGVLDALARAKKTGWVLVVVTNQWPVGSGRLPREALLAIHARMRREAAAAGAPFDRVATCTHAALERCACAKPSPRMILDAAKDLDVDLARSWMMGDQRKDVLAGRAAGCHTALVNPAWRPATLLARREADIVAAGVPEAVERALAWKG